MSPYKINLPMLDRQYVVTLKEQQELACRFGRSLEDVRAELLRLSALMDKSTKTANKVKKAIDAHFETSNGTVVRAL
jgi:hypothetical protein